MTATKQAIKSPISANIATGDKKRLLLHSVLIFGISTAVALVFHALAEPPRRALCFDARQYLSNTQYICDFIISLMHGRPDTTVVTGKAFVEAILSDGPVLPGFFAGLFALCGHSPSVSDWRLIQTIQSVMHGLSSAMVFILTERLTGNVRYGRVAGLMWGLYPAAIFWSGVYYTETTVVFFLLLFLVLFSRKIHRFRSTMATAISAGLVMLLKPALVPATALTCLLLCAKKKQNFLAVALGLCLAIAPWAVYTKIFTGTARFTAYRNPSFNLAMGSDTEVDGCYVWPGAPLTAMFAQDECAIAFPLAQWQFRTSDCLRMTARKISCLWGAQSNDLRQNYFLLNPTNSNLIHGFLVVLGFAGLFLFAGGGFKKLDTTRQRIGLSIAIFVCGHLVYILFTPAARYGFTSMPLLCILAAYAMQCVCERANLPSRKSLVLILSTLLPWCALLFLGEKLARQNEPAEIAHTLAAGETAIKELDLSGCKWPDKTSQVVLMIDGNDDLCDAEITVNGVPLPGNPVHLRQLSSRVYDRCWDLLSLGYPMGISMNQFRQWKGLCVPEQLIKKAGKNVITICRKAGPCLVYSNRDPNGRKMFSPDYCSVNNVSNSPDSLDPRLVSLIPTARINQHSMLHKPPAANLIDTKDSLRVHLCVQFDCPAIACPQAGNEVLSSPRQLAFEHQFALSEFDLYMQDKSINGIRTNRHVMKAAQRAGTVVDLPPAPQYTHMIVKVSGQIRSLAQPKEKAAVVVAIIPGRGTPSLTLASTPDFVEAEKNWKQFLIEDTVPVCLLGSGKRSLYVAAYPGAWLDICGYGPTKRMSDVQIKDISAQVLYANKTDLASGRTIFY